MGQCTLREKRLPYADGHSRLMLLDFGVFAHAHSPEILQTGGAVGVVGELGAMQIRDDQGVAVNIMGNGAPAWAIATVPSP
ncbi:MAG: hypothetical protein MJ025_02190 [Victivallaceae bacterium]|nr:hypothetical protein [Victivallaceae bacterium]